MARQDQSIESSQIHNSQVQLARAGRDAVSFQNSQDNQVTINNALLQLGPSGSPGVNWDWARRLLEKKQLPNIRKRLTDTLGRERALMSVGLREELSWVGRSPLEPARVLQIEGKAEAPLNPHQLLIETFRRDDIAGKLLILGTPGSGKTTALLSLAEQLVCGALDQPKTVIPVLFELSTWRKDNQSIHDWLIEQLYEQHGGNRKAKVYERWLDEQVLLPLMDGLDELGFERQQKCTQKLKTFAGQYPYLVVCCRTKEFTQAGIKLNTLNGAIRLEPLSDQQIQVFLQHQQSPLWSVIQTNPRLKVLLETTLEGDPGLLRVPLFVALAARTYDSKHPFESKKDLLNQYIERQVSRDMRESDRRNDLEKKNWVYQTLEQEPGRHQTQRTLIWLAQQLQKNNTVELLIEHMQPSWLERKWERQRYRLTFGLVYGLIVGLLGTGLFAGLGLLIFGPVGGLLGASAQIEPVEAFKITLSQDVRREILNSLRNWLIGGFVFGLIIGLGVGQMYGLARGLASGLADGLAVGLMGGLIYGLVRGLKQDLKLRSRPNQGISQILQFLKMRP